MAILVILAIYVAMLCRLVDFDYVVYGKCFLKCFFSCF